MTEEYDHLNVWFVGAVVSAIALFAGLGVWVVYKHPRKSLHLFLAFAILTLVPYGIGKLTIRRLEND